MARRLGFAVVAIVLAFGAVPIVAQNQNPMARIADQWQMGCISCHTSGVMGETLNVTMGRMEHPDITRSVQEVPNGCVMCHRNGTLSPLVHKAHFRRGQAANAPSMPCMACHTMNRTTGEAETKNSPANW